MTVGAAAEMRPSSDCDADYIRWSRAEPGPRHDEGRRAPVASAASEIVTPRQNQRRDECRKAYCLPRRKWNSPPVGCG
jgi:hypothetical protein